jgi:hypothetical protein
MAGMLETQAGDRSYDTGIPNIHVGQISFQCAGMTIFTVVTQTALGSQSTR